MKRLLDLELTDKQIAAVIEYLDPDLTLVATHPGSLSDQYVSSVIDYLDPDREDEVNKRESSIGSAGIWIGMLLIYLLAVVGMLALWGKLTH